MRVYTRNIAFPRMLLRIVLTSTFLSIIVGRVLWYHYGMPSPFAQKISDDGSAYAAIIPNVPYIGLFNRVGEYGYMVNELHGAAAMLMEHYDPERHRQAAVREEYLARAGNRWGATDSRSLFMQSLLRRYGFAVEEHTWQEYDIRAHFKSNVARPLIVFMPASPMQDLQVTFLNPVVVLGIDARRNAVVVHDYYAGPYLRIPFDEFELRMNWGGEDAALHRRVITVTPLIEQVAAAAPDPRCCDTPLLVQELRALSAAFTEALLADYMYAGNLISFDIAYRNYRDVAADPAFATAPPYYRVWTHYSLARHYLNNGDFLEAERLAGRAVAENERLNEPQGDDWRGIEFQFNGSALIDRISGAHRVHGDALRLLGKHSDALRAYQMALRIAPENEHARYGLDIVR